MKIMMMTFNVSRLLKVTGLCLLTVGLTTTAFADDTIAKNKTDLSCFTGEWNFDSTNLEVSMDIENSMLISMEDEDTLTIDSANVRSVMHVDDKIRSVQDSGIDRVKMSQETKDFSEGMSVKFYTGEDCQLNQIQYLQGKELGYGYWKVIDEGQTLSQTLTMPSIDFTVNIKWVR